MLATDRSVSREARTLPALSIGRKIGPAPMRRAIEGPSPAASAQACVPRQQKAATNGKISATAFGFCSHCAPSWTSGVHRLSGPFPNAPDRMTA